MLSKDDLVTTREQLVERREELMRRAEELRERFAESVDQDLIVNTTGFTLISAGASLGIVQWIRGRRSVLALLLPAGLLVAGLGMLGGGFMHRRGIRIDEAEMAVREQLAALDPVARFHVLRDVGRDSVPFVRHSHN